jgi:glycosyltransferase involved in cell wall biosynthesis
MTDVLIVGQFFPPETGAGARRAGALSTALANRLDLVVLTLEPSYPDASLYGPEDAARIDMESEFRIKRLFRFDPYRASHSSRGLAEIGMAVRIAWAALRMSWQTAIVSTPSMFLAPCMFLVCVLRRRHFIWDLRDLTWRYIAETGRAGRAERIIGRGIELVMGWLLRAASLVIVTNQGAGTMLAADYAVESSNIVVLPNGVSRAFFDQFESAEAHTQARPVVLYLGLLGRNHGVEVLTQVAPLVPEADFVIVGDGPMRPAIEARLRTQDPGNLKLQGYSVDQERIVQYYRDATILFNHTLDTPTLSQAVLAAKIVEYMATGKPIVSGGAGVPEDLLRSIGCAELVRSGDPHSIANGVRHLLADPARRAALGKRGREYVSEYALREELMGRFAEQFAVGQRTGGRDPFGGRTGV